MNPRFLVGVGLRSSVHAALTDRPFQTIAFQRDASCATATIVATAVAAEAQDQRGSQRIKDRQTERFR